MLVCVTALLTLGVTGWAVAAPAQVVYHGPTDKAQIALTFDDNADPDRALATLRALEKAGVPATTFVIGANVKAFPSINRELVKGGFEVGDHSGTHAILTRLSWQGMAREIGAGTDAFRAATGARTVPLFRPPYGTTNSTVAQVGGSEGFSYLVLWDVDPRDWAGGSAQSIADHVVGHAHNGAIVVMHMSAPHTAEAIPLIARRLRDRGYELVTVSKMLKGGRRFLDVDEDLAVGQAILRMVDAGIMNGYGENYFGPDDPLTRAQLAKVAVLTAGIHTEPVEAADPTFSDVPLRHDAQGDPLPYPFDYVEEAALAGLVSGTEEDGLPVFRPQASVTRLQLAQVVARMVREFKGYPEAGQYASASDVDAVHYPDVPDYAQADVALLARLGVMSGYSLERFDCWSAARRGHVALVMSRFLDLAPFGG